MSDAPTIWTFSGPAALHTHYDLKVWGKPSAKALRHIILQLELTASFMEEDDTPPTTSMQEDAGK